METTTAAAPAFARPEPDEHAEFYAGYIARVPEGDVVAVLDAQLREVADFFRGLPPELHEHRYAPGKWSMKEVLGHMTDAERIFAYRALRIARGDQTPLPGWNENRFMEAVRFDRRSMDSLVDEWADARRATLSLVRGLEPEAAERRGIANDSPVSVRALVYIVAGHTDHHLNVVRTRYLPTS
jgi:uncharacterized damage-inducible protein DinB